MIYLVPGGAAKFKYDTDKVFKVGFVEKRVSGSNLLPIIDAIKHYEAVSGAGGSEQQRALCSILSRSNKWYTIKEAKVKVKKGVRTGTETLVKRTRVVGALMNEAMQALNAFHPTLTTAMTSYLKNKNNGARGGGGLSGGYANERNAYLMFNKSTSLSGSIIDDYLFKNKDRNLNTLPTAQNKHFQTNYRSKGKELSDLTLEDWRAIHEIAGQLGAQQMEVRYMKRHERLNFMLESDGAGGLRYIIGPRSADSSPDQWAYAMDDYGNIYTANDRLAGNRTGYAIFNHSSFTAGDNVICAGMLRINNAGRLTQIDNGSGHYKPNKDQLIAVLTILRDEYAVDLAPTEVVLYTPNPTGLAPNMSTWNAGHAANFLAGGNPDS